MVNGMSKAGSVSRRTRLGVLCALLGATVPTLGAQERGDEMVTVLKSGLHSVRAGDVLQVIMAEVGPTTSTSEVRIVVLDAADQRRGIATGVLMRGKPVRLRVRVPRDSMGWQLRTVVQILGLTNQESSQPVATLEDIDADSLRIETKPPCAPLPSVGGGAEGNCDGWGVTRLALDQAGDSGLD
jgi:hypothetical protein